MKRTFFLLAVLLTILIGCQNFDYTHSVCNPEVRVDIKDLDQPHYQLAQTLALFGGPTIEGADDIGITKLNFERKDKGLYQLTTSSGTQGIAVCKIGNKVLVEPENGSALGSSRKRALFQYDAVADGFILTAVEVDLKKLKASKLKYQTIADRDTLTIGKDGVLTVVEKTPEQIAKDLKANVKPVKGLVVDTSDAKDAAQLVEMLHPGSEAIRIYKGTYK